MYIQTKCFNVCSHAERDCVHQMSTPWSVFFVFTTMLYICNITKSAIAYCYVMVRCTVYIGHLDPLWRHFPLSHWRCKHKNVSNALFVNFTYVCNAQSIWQLVINGMVMAWCRTGDKPLSESMMTYFTAAYICQSASGNWQRIMYVNEWRTVSALMRRLFWCLFPELRSNEGNEHQNNTWVCTKTVCQESTYITLFLTRHNESINEDKSDDIHTSSPCLTVGFRYDDDDTIDCWWRDNDHTILTRSPE